ncbi:nuclear transport factor 2 family protein [Pokkaliibacter plantistimulans]|uniref:Nuclear transport factor 2 family protein n=1 Tax=Proteobacteria bacterium 228 TaxID=2083153 RepID=A0A2S5KXH3_9PROT|nr:nuclear transport factor 2 family protein [Pokkaliibacter plantistimulans]PPC79423.1 nuclear transport factor 2 family protein [Pokkaliibacter plantistimulans]
MTASITHVRQAADAQPESAQHADILAFEQARQRALITADRVALQQLMADDLTHVHSTGMVHSKQELLDHVERMGGFIAIERGPLRIRVEGAVAIVTGTTLNTVRSRETGQPVTLDGFSTLLLRRADHGWQVVLSQLTPHRPRP